MSIVPRPDGMSDEEWADYAYQHRNDPVDPADIETLESVPSPRLSVNASVRLTPEEHQAIQRAAEESGMTISAYIRARILDAGRTVDYSRVRADLERISSALGDLRNAIAT